MYRYHIRLSNNSDGMVGGAKYTTRSWILTWRRTVDNVQNTLQEFVCITVDKNQNIFHILYHPFYYFT